MENPEEILHSLEEFTKLKPKDIPRELEEYLCFVAKTGDPVYQWVVVKNLFREKLISVITDFYESCPSVEVPPCPNVEVFNYEIMKTFILEKLDTFVAAPFTVQRICELLTTPRKEYNRIDKYMRALEKNILVVSTTEPLNRRATGNAEGIVNGLESEHVETSKINDINVEEMDVTPVWSHVTNETSTHPKPPIMTANVEVEVADQSEFASETRKEPIIAIDSVITFRSSDNQPFVSIEPVVSDNCVRESASETDITVTITAIPAAVQKRRDSIEPIVSSIEEESSEMSSPMEIEVSPSKEDVEMTCLPSSSPSEPIATHTANIEIISIAETTEPLCTEAQPSVTATSCTSVFAPEITTNIIQSEKHSAVIRKSKSLIQIPVISEITSDVDTNLDPEASIPTHVISVQKDSNSDVTTIVSEPSEVLEEVSTSTPEPATSTDSHPNFETVIEVTKETTVSSSNDLNSEAVELKTVEIIEENSSSQEESSSESADNSSEAEQKQIEEVVSCEIQEFASSSTSIESISIEEETCQEAPTFNR